MTLKPSAKELLGQNVNRLRQLRGLTQEGLAAAAQVDRRYVQRIEAGTGNPGVEVLTQLKQALRCRWEELLGK